MTSDDEMPAYFQSTFDMVSRAFPEGVPAGDRPSLIVALYEDMSLRSIAHFLTFFDRSDYHANYNDIAGALSKEKAPAPRTSPV
jgi:hypothetical protein